jgi:hypothetical protein
MVFWACKDMEGDVSLAKLVVDRFPQGIPEESRIAFQVPLQCYLQAREI